MAQLTFDDQWKENLIVSFSGGVGSAATALTAFEHGLEFECVFADTMIEDEDLHRFMDDVAAVIGQTIVKLSCGMTPWDVFRKVKYIGNTRTAHCSALQPKTENRCRSRVDQRKLHRQGKTGDPDPRHGTR